ncbi:MAG TPA: hypothetical protein VFW62_13320 [bacterium]|nr:hypothetical protein [bacterium]
MKKALGLFFLLSACAGGISGSGMGDLSPTGGEVGGGAPPPLTVAGAAGATGTDGVLGSQSSSSDIEVNFYREYALDFEGEIDVQDAVVERPMVLPGQAYGQAKVRKIDGGLGKSLQYSVNPTSQSATIGLSHFDFLQTWVRAVYCGNFPDSEIEPLIPAADKDQPWAADKLLWFIFHLPKQDSPGIAKCHQPTYRDFPIETFGAVDLSALAGSPQDLFIFVRVDSADFGSAGELSQDTAKTLSDEQWLALSKEFKLRFVRLLPAGSTIRAHPVPPVYLSPN